MNPQTLRRILRGPKICPDCGSAAHLGESCCPDCGARLYNRNPLLRFAVTVAAMAIVAGVIWWKLRR